MTALHLVILKLSCLEEGAEEGEGTAPAEQPTVQTSETGSSIPASQQAERTAGSHSQLQLRLLMPASVCGSIIGRQGVTIKEFAADSGCSFSLSPRDPDRLDYDRIITISGPPDRQLRASALITHKAMESPYYAAVGMRQLNLGRAAAAAAAAPTPVQQQQQPVFPFPGATAGLMAPPFLPRSVQGFVQQGTAMQQVAAMQQGTAMQQGSAGQQSSTLLQQAAPVVAMSPAATSATAQPFVEMFVTVPKWQVGIIVGRGGSNLQSLKNLLGVKISIPDADQPDLPAGMRKVSISGPREQVQLAHQILAQKLQEAAAVAMQTQPRML